MQLNLNEKNNTIHYPILNKNKLFYIRKNKTKQKKPPMVCETIKWPKLISISEMKYSKSIFRQRFPTAINAPHAQGLVR